MTETTELLDRATKAMTPNYTPPPFVLERGQGVKLWDTDGEEYLDFAAGIGVNALGHAHPQVAKAIADQAHLLCHTSNLYYHKNYILLAERISQLAFTGRVFLANSGTEANEGALKLARRYFYERKETRTEFVAANNSFHGRTFGALSVTGQPNLHEGFAPLIPGVSFVPFGDLDAIKAAVHASTAAVILEPIQGNGGVFVPSPGYFSGVREICDRVGCLLIVDEVQTCMGRTGKWFAHHYENIVPDIMTFAKGVGGGLPLGGMIAKENVSAALKPTSHASTFGGNPVACAAGLATIDVIEKQKLLPHVIEMGSQITEALRKLNSQFPEVKDVRGRGLMIGLVLDRPAKPVSQACLQRRLLTSTAGANVLRLLPPLIVQPVDIQQAVEIIKASLTATRT